MAAISFCVDIHDINFRSVKGWNLGIPSVPYWRLWWNDRPGGCVQVDDAEYSLTPETLLLIPPHTLCRRSLDSSLFHLNCHFNLGLPWDLVRGRAFELEAPQHIESIIADATTETGTAGQFATGELLMAAFRQIPSQVFDELTFDQRIRIAIKHMELHRNRLVQNEELAGLVHVTANTFIRLFKAQTGISPQVFHKQMRLDYAAILLTQHTHMTIEEVADATGFHDRHHLSRAFKDRYNCSPSAYRRLAGR